MPMRAPPRGSGVVGIVSFRFLRSWGGIVRSPLVPVLSLRQRHEPHFVGREKLAVARAAEMDVGDGRSFDRERQKRNRLGGGFATGNGIDGLLIEEFSVTIKASTTAGQPVEPQSTSVTEDAPVPAKVILRGTP